MANFLWGFLFSATGAGFFMYGRKQTAVVPLACGLALMAYPYFVDDVVSDRRRASRNPPNALNTRPESGRGWAKYAH